uniref:Uncharacterized protein n=1 Tax=viral metagenome TaxID=1070528 RepID=A0A6C0HFS7_9ZZZZ
MFSSPPGYFKEKEPNLMRQAGIEPALQPWKSCILPLNYQRATISRGFEPLLQKEIA